MDLPELNQVIRGELTLGGGFLGPVVLEAGVLPGMCLSLGSMYCLCSEAGFDEVDAVS